VYTVSSYQSHSVDIDHIRNPIRMEGVVMAEPKTEVDRRMDRIEKAITTFAAMMISDKTGFNEKDLDDINDILHGRTEATSNGSVEETP
jgi:hypothetical protein